MVQIETSALRVTILPEVGGKVGQIHDKRTGNDLLIGWRKPYRTIPTDGDWLQHDTSGMDDCFPNVAAGRYPLEPWTNLQLPDLGEWTHGTWNLVSASVTEVVLERGGDALPYFARKTVRFIGEDLIEFEYRVANRCDAPLRYLWSAHPLIAVPGDYRLELPPGDLTFRVFPPEGEQATWPFYGNVDLSREWISSGTNLKVFVTGLKEGWCRLRLPAHSLHFTFDLQSVPVIGLWFNHFGFPDDKQRAFRCIAVEPCTSASDLLDELDAAEYPLLAPGAVASWSLQLRIASTPDNLASIRY